MGIMDAKGRIRSGMFEVIRDEATETTFTPVAGSGVTTLFRAEGPKVVGNGMFETRNYSSPTLLAMAAKAQGVLKSDPLPGIRFVTPPGKFET